MKKKSLAAAIAAGTVLMGSAASAHAAVVQPKPATRTIDRASLTATTQATGGAGMIFTADNPNYRDVAKAPYVILHQQEWSKIPAIRSVNPKAKIFFYSNASAYSVAAKGSFQPNVVTYWQVQQHPEWVLKNANGSNYTWDYYDYLQPLDLGNTQYQNYAISNLVKEIKSHGWDGVYFDDINYNDMGHGRYNPPVNLTGGDRFTATTNFLKKVAPAIKQQTGKEIAINPQQDWNEYEREIRTWAPLVDMINLEHAAAWQDDNKFKVSSPYSNQGNYLDEAMMEWRLKEMNLIQSLGKKYSFMTTVASGDTQAQAYHRAMFYMGWDGKSDSVSLLNPATPGASYWDWISAYDLGKPTGPAQRVQPYVYKRTFTKGTLYLNSSKKNVTIDGINLPPTTANVR